MSPRADVLILEGFISVHDGTMVLPAGIETYGLQKLLLSVMHNNKYSFYIPFDGLMFVVGVNRM